jgi:hypothetical protein
MNNPLDVKENDEHALDFALQFRLGRLLLRLGVIIVNPTLITRDNHEQEGCIIEKGSAEAPRRRRQAAASDQLLEITSGPIHNSKQKDIENQHVHPAA